MVFLAAVGRSMGRADEEQGGEGMAQPTDPKLWEEAKKEQRATSEGSPPGRWSARKAVLAQREYERRGGGWEPSPAPKGGTPPRSG